MKAGGNVVVDVRDLAMAHERMMRPGLGPRRFMAGGRFITWQENVDLLQDLTGRNFKAPKISTRMVLAIGRVGDLMARFTPIQPPIDYEGAYYMSHLTPSDDSAIHDDLGVKWRPTEESMRDMLVWMVAAGHIDPKKAGTIGAT